MTQEEADKLIRDAEDAHSKRKPVAKPGIAAPPPRIEPTRPLEGSARVELKPKTPVVVPPTAPRRTPPPPPTPPPAPSHGREGAKPKAASHKAAPVKSPSKKPGHKPAPKKAVPKPSTKKK
jgi:hypothetical protein